MRRCLILAALLSATPAAAFITTRGDRTRWFRVPQPGIGALSTDLPAADCRAALVRAFATWASVEGADLALPPPIDGPADLTIGFVSGVPELAGVLGSTVTTTEGEAIVRAEVVLNDDFQWALDGPRGTFRVQATATHELGHALGLAHSPHRDAAMYWHYDPAGTELTEDDRRGIRFLYGDRTGRGQPCDQCLLPADCAEGICLQSLTEPGRAHCARPCRGGCGADETCVGLAGGGDACVPAVGFCGDGRGLPSGAACWGPDQCAGGRCIVFPGDARCAAACTVPGDCGPGEVCALDPVDLPRACLRPGPRAFGAPCTWATDCADGVCLPEGRCSRWCGDCPAGWQCAATGAWPDRPRVCRPTGGPEPPDAAAHDAAHDAAARDATPRDGEAPDARPAGTEAPDAPVPPADARPSTDGGPTLVPPAGSSSADGCAIGPRRSGAAWLLAWAVGCRRGGGRRRRAARCRTTH